uniref:Uncharacterized protein n=1 Tax=Mycobacterium phage Wildflower TaxID=3141619 RepID=A0AB38ZP52_9VIRU
MPGEPIEIGDMLGHDQEPNLITGRVFGFIKSAPVLVIARRYRDQTEKWPSGEFFATAIPFPHRHDCGECKRFIWSP